MQELDDIALLRQYTEQNSEEAFAALVTRHVNKVYSVALRHTRNPHSAEEITQAVFVVLAKKSAHLGKKVVLSGWLYETSRLTALTFIRGEIRRARREQEAYMQNVLNENEDAIWPQIAPLLDEAMAGLRETDRHVVVLRFFDGKSIKEVGAALGASEDAAKMRLTRAVEKLRGFFTRRGIVLPASVLTTTISTHSVQTAPVALAKSVTAVALAKGAAASGSTLTLIKGALKIMAWTKTKTTIITTVAILLTTGGAGLAAFEIIHAIRVAHYPNIQGYWEGVMPLGAVGINKGQSESTRIVVKLSKRGGKYTASFDALDVGQKDLPMAKVDYDFPTIQLAMFPNRNMVYQGKLNAAATTMKLNGLTLRKLPAPAAYRPLEEGDFAPGAASNPQGYWKGEILAPDGKYPDGLGGLQLGGTGSPKDASSRLPINLKIAVEPDGTYRAELDNPMQGADGQPASVTVGQGKIQLALDSKNGMLSLVMEASGQEMSGSWIQGGESTPAIFKRADYQAELARCAEEDYSSTSRSDLQGHWKGSWGTIIKTPNQKINLSIPMELDVAKMLDGTYSVAIANLEQLGNENPIPASSFQYSPPNLHAEWKWAGGTYDGRLENGKIAGTWTEGGGRFALVFERQK